MSKIGAKQTRALDFETQIAERDECLGATDVQTACCAWGALIRPIVALGIEEAEELVTVLVPCLALSFMAICPEGFCSCSGCAKSLRLSPSASMKAAGHQDRHV